ncbi:MAG TPA: MBL fold metallo-hydrolase, partial [Opitutaceae bacterium]
MPLIFFSRLVFAGVVAVLFAAQAHARVVGRVHALGQAGVKIEVTGGPVIYIDPYRLTTTPADADYILITHNHGDHQSLADINRVRKASTVFVSSPPGVPALQTAYAGSTIHAVAPGSRLMLGGVEVETVPMYNIVKNNHPRAMNFVGYVLNIGGMRLYHAGDTERIPEMRTFSCDVAMLPLGQTFTMTSVADAVNAALDLRARVAIPIHWGMAEGTRADADQFAAALSGRMQVVLETGSAGFPLEVSETIRFAEQPVSATVAPGSSAALRAQASGAGTLRYQWRRDGLSISGATSPTLSIERAAAADAGDYTLIVTDANGSVTSRMARVTVATPAPGPLTNLSVRASTRGAAAPLIVGCVMQGTKPVLVRGIGPSLATFGITNAISDPRIDIFSTTAGVATVVAVNNDWGTPINTATVGSLQQTFVAVGAFNLVGTASLDAALITPFSGAQTLHVVDARGASGVALVEVYDPAPTAAGRLVNLSARNFAGTGENTLIAGFAVGGNVPKRLLIRGIGPSLSAFGVAGVLSDPRIDLYLTESDGRSALFASNDNWVAAGVATAREAFAVAGAFNLPDVASRDAALVVT